MKAAFIFRRFTVLLVLIYTLALHSPVALSEVTSNVLLDIPQSGLKAEMQGDWELAIDIYQGVLEASPDRWDLHRRLVEIYSTTGRPAKALASMRILLQQYPNDSALLEDHAKLATWAGRYQEAANSYEKLISRVALPDQYLIKLALVESWQGNLDRAAGHFKDYLSRNTQDGDAYLGYAYTQSWRGNFAHGLELLEKYRDSAGDEELYDRARTRFLARAGRVRIATQLADTTLQNSPDDYHANFSKTLALKEGWRFSSALESLEKTKNCCEDQQSTNDLERIIRMPLRHFIHAQWSNSDDSDDVEIDSVSIEGSYRLTTELYLTAGIEEKFLHAPIGSGLNSTDGTSGVDTRKGWVGVDYAVNEALWLNGKVGSHKSDFSDSLGIYMFDANYRPVDSLYIQASADRDLHAVSPRAVSLGISRKRGSVRAIWTPDLRYTADLQGSFSSFSDSNERKQLALAVRRSFARTERYNLDFGLSARWTSFDRALNNGYYEPSNYRQFLFTSYAYFKLSDDDGISLIIAPGVHKDENMSEYELSGNLSLDGTFGLYKDWMIKTHIGLISNISVNDQTYQRGEFNLSVTRRF